MRLLFVFLSVFTLLSAVPTYKIGLVKYNGGGDWYANKETSLPNLIKFCNQELKTSFQLEQGIVELASPELFLYPILHMTGHGNILLNEEEIINLRKYLLAGGFLHISDNYGFDKYLRPQIKRLFPELDFIELPFNHAIYKQKFIFSSGLPKIHEHDNGAPKGLGLIYKGRLICFYDFECDLGDGWESYEVHKDSEQTRKKALQMGANIIQFAFTQQNE